jgi:hypothetical protein
MDALGTLPGKATRNTRPRELDVAMRIAAIEWTCWPCYEARQQEIYAPRELDTAMRSSPLLHIYKKGCGMLVSERSLVWFW